MFTHRVTLFRLFGFDVKADLSWVFLAVLVTWSLASGVMPSEQPGLPVRTYWAMGVLGAIGLFASIVVHEVAHSLVARHFGIPIKDITLFIFGGVADMEDEPPSARSEFFMAVAGPATSVALAALFYGIYRLFPTGASVHPAATVIYYIAWLNGILAAFNMVPAFPLDGGRVLRAILWGAQHNLRRATRIAAQIGAGFGTALIVLAVLALLGGSVVAGLWWFMIGLFVRSASQMSYRHLLVRRVLEGEPVRRFMHPEPVTVSPIASIEHVIREYVYKYHYKMFPVVDEDGRLLGAISTREIKAVPHDEWAQHTVAEVMAEDSLENCLDPDTDAMDVLSRMNRRGVSRMMVVEQGHLVGILTLKDLLAFLALKMEFEADDVA